MDGILKRRGKNKEADPKFNIKTNEGFEMEVKRFFVVCQRPRKVVVLGTVVNGEIKVGDSFTLTSENGTLSDSVRRIERNRKGIDYAVRNEQIGICLMNTTIRQLRKFNNEISV